MTISLSNRRRVSHADPRCTGRLRSAGQQRQRCHWCRPGEPVVLSMQFPWRSKGKGSTGNAIRGINYAVDQRNRGVNVTVINASWGGPNESQSLRDAITAAGDAGILFICSAGNDGADVDQTPPFPSGFGGLPACLSVAALTSTDNLASFSNFGHDAVGVAAPGQSILSTAPRNQFSPNGAYSTLSGTSMSAPYVSGIAVLLWSHERSLTPAQVKHRIVSTSEPTPALASKAANSGRANAFNALTNQIAPPRSPMVLRASFTRGLDAGGTCFRERIGVDGSTAWLPRFLHISRTANGR